MDAKLVQKMKKIRNGIFDLVGLTILLYTIAFIPLMIAGLQLRAWVNVACAVFVGVCVLLWLLLTFITADSIKKRITMGVTLLGIACFLWIFRFPLFIFCAAVPHKERVDTIDGKTFVGYEDNFWDKSIDYYEYKNFIVSGAKRIFSLYTVEEKPDGSIAYYDMDGNRLDHLQDLHEYRYVDELKE